ncbi:MAG: ArsR family transcriptional regulator [Chloroflexi bacterium]|nr:ArsR family transcriptional regulator [Chloroflexota bacterium]
MQKTRQKILEYLHEHGEATVNELSKALDGLTAVTVRHHLDVLRSEGLIAQPVPRHRSTPGRPRYVYSLTEKGDSLFPGNVKTLADHMFGEVVGSLQGDQINVIFDGIADRMADELEVNPHASPQDRLDLVVRHLTEQGYEAKWEATAEGYLLHTFNCPYEQIATHHEEMCSLDMRYISRLLGTVPRRLGKNLIEGGSACSYLISYSEQPYANGFRR